MMIMILRDWEMIMKVTYFALEFSTNQPIKTDIDCDEKLRDVK